MSLRTVMTWVGVGVFLLTLAGIPARATYGAQTTADEPQYLLTALSLFEDGDLDIADERYSAAYRDFHEATLPVQTELRPGGTRVSPHNPLLPLVLAVPMGLGGWVAAKTMLAGLAGGLAALLVWVGVRRLSLPLVPTAIVVAVFALSPPLALYATQVYPELPAALAVTMAIAALTGRPNRANTALLVVALVALPWLAVKYVPVAAVLGLFALRWLKDSPTLSAGLIAVAAVGGISYLWFNQTVYGGWTPYASGDFFVAGEIVALGPEPNYLGRAQRLLGLWVDRGFGLVAWQPAYLLAVPALAWSVRSRGGPWRMLALVAGAGWLVATFLAQTMHGWWWPGRQVVVVLPALILLTAAWLIRHAHRMRIAVVTGALGVISFFVLAVEATVGRLTLVVDFFTTANPFYRVWSRLLPDYLEVTPTTWVLHTLWLVLAGLLAWWGSRSDVTVGFPEIGDIEDPVDLASLR